MGDLGLDGSFGLERAAGDIPTTKQTDQATPGGNLVPCAASIVVVNRIQGTKVVAVPVVVLTPLAW
jgi:hypothetical protein